MYLIDANVLIEAKNRYYAFDIAPGFWAWLDQTHRSGAVGSIEAIREELLAGDDMLSDWVRANRNFFLPLDEASTAFFPALTAWAQGGRFTAGALAGFAGDNADFQLVAYARAHDHVVVTSERANPDRRNRVKIPDACTALGVVSLDPFDMMRRTGAVLELRE